MIQKGLIVYDWLEQKILLPEDLQLFRFVFGAGTEKDQLEKAIAKRTSKASVQPVQPGKVNSIRLGISPQVSDSNTEKELSDNNSRVVQVGVKTVRAEKSRMYKDSRTQYIYCF